MTYTTYGKKWRPGLEIIAQDFKRVLEDGRTSLDDVQMRTGYRSSELDRVRDYLIARSEIMEVDGQYELK